MLETRWYDCGPGYCVLVMDPAISGLGWTEVQTLIEAGQRLPVTVYQSNPWGYEIAPVTQADYIVMCRTEAQRLAELAFAPATPVVFRS